MNFFSSCAVPRLIYLIYVLFILLSCCLPPHISALLFPTLLCAWKACLAINHLAFFIKPIRVTLLHSVQKIIPQKTSLPVLFCPLASAVKMLSTVVFGICPLDVLCTLCDRT